MTFLAGRVIPFVSRLSEYAVANHIDKENKCYLTIFAWFISFNKDISRIAVLGTPSDSLLNSKWSSVSFKTT